MKPSNLQKLLEGVGFRVCLAEIQHQERTRSVVLVSEFLIMLLQVYPWLGPPFVVAILACCCWSQYTKLGKTDITAAAQKKIQTNVRVLKGHSGAVTALHSVTRREVYDLVGDREDAGFFISGSTDCLVGIKCIVTRMFIWVFFFIRQFLIVLLDFLCNYTC